MSKWVTWLFLVILMCEGRCWLWIHKHIAMYKCSQAPASWFCLSRPETTDLCHHPCFKHPCCPTYWEVRAWRKRQSRVFLFFFHVTMSDMSNWLVWETNQCRKDNVRASSLPCSSYFSVWSKFYLWRKPWPPWVVSLFIAKRGPSTCAVWASLNTPWSQSPGIHCLGKSTALSATVWQGRWTHTANIFTMTVFVPLSHQMSIPRCTFKDKIK